MKKLNITKEQFNKSRYFKNKYGKLEYVSESGKIFKTSKGQVLKFKESLDNTDYKTYIAGIYNIPGGDVFDVISAIGIQEAIDYLIENVLLDDTRRDPEEYADMDEINPDVAAQELKTQRWTKLDDSNIAFISELPYNG